MMGEFWSKWLDFTPGPDEVLGDAPLPDLCPTCGASWACEHRAPETAGLREVAPDGPTLVDEMGSDWRDRVRVRLSSTSADQYMLTWLGSHDVVQDNGDGTYTHTLSPGPLYKLTLSPTKFSAAVPVSSDWDFWHTTTVGWLCGGHLSNRPRPPRRRLRHRERLREPARHRTPSA